MGTTDQFRRKDGDRPGTGVRTAPEPAATPTDESSIELLRQLVAHLRQNRAQLRQELARRITGARLPPR